MVEIEAVGLRVVPGDFRLVQQRDMCNQGEFEPEEMISVKARL